MIIIQFAIIDSCEVYLFFLSFVEAVYSSDSYFSKKYRSAKKATIPNRRPTNVHCQKKEWYNGVQQDEGNRGRTVITGKPA